MTDRFSTAILAAALAALVAFAALVLAVQPQPAGPAPVAVELPSDARHDAMMRQMRLDVSPAMAERMQDAQLWPMVRDPGRIQMLEDRQDRIDRMLGRVPSGPRR